MKFHPDVTSYRAIAQGRRGDEAHFREADRQETRPTTKIGFKPTFLKIPLLHQPRIQSCQVIYTAFRNPTTATWASYTSLALLGACLPLITTLRTKPPNNLKSPLLIYHRGIVLRFLSDATLLLNQALSQQEIPPVLQLVLYM